MTLCQIQAATLHSFPRGPMPVEDRRISLDTRCNEAASFSAHMFGTSGGRSRTGAPAKDFLLCENHSQLVAQVDRELKEEGWGPAVPAKPVPLL